MKNANFSSPLMFWADAVDAAAQETAVAGAVKAYERGDYERALPQLSGLANDGHPTAQHYLGEMYATGAGVSAEPQTAIGWFTAAACGGCVRAQVRLGRAYADGDLGAPRDAAQAYAWLELAARGGSAEAVSMLGALTASMVESERRRARELALEHADPGLQVSNSRIHG